MVDVSSSRARADALLAVVRAHAPEAALGWLSRGVQEPGEAFARGPFFGFFAGAARRFGEAAAGPFQPDERERAALLAAGVAAPEAWTLPDVVRAVLLLRALPLLPPDAHTGLLREAILKGDTGERVSALRALPLLPEPERFVELAVDACRSHVQDVFEAVACHNAYPAAHFPQPSFNQLVMKALFTEVPLSRVLGWRGRVEGELVRMATDYEAERRAAGRSVPDDIAAIRAQLAQTQETTP